MKKNVLVIGGYGGVGKYVVEYLLRNHDVNVVIAGRNKQKADNYRNYLLSKYPGISLESRSVDARKKEDLTENFDSADLVIVAATIPDKMDLIAECALQSGSDVMDILFRGDVIEKLNKYKTSIIKNGRIFITQCGFHPGMIAPTIRMAGSSFDVYKEASVAMAMDPVFYTAESLHELIYEIIKG
ncbi:MAG: NAD(P)H-binding protein, partial [Saprospiraceae bacterium]|nr:NAD(P)H-binding protein [Saprospiraceae bacterium]